MELLWPSHGAAPEIVCCTYTTPFVVVAAMDGLLAMMTGLKSKGVVRSLRMTSWNSTPNWVKFSPEMAALMPPDLKMRLADSVVSDFGWARVWEAVKAITKLVAPAISTRFADIRSLQYTS